MRVSTAHNAVVGLKAETTPRRELEADEALARGELHGPLQRVPLTLKNRLAPRA
ncbi:MAG: hypothetical protein ABIP61_03095 [Burkholderiaceae bacterium]